MQVIAVQGAYVLCELGKFGSCHLSKKYPLPTPLILGSGQNN
jgi:hypothetical protein